MKKIVLLYYIMLCICLVCFGCQSSEQIVENAINKAKDSCPIEVSKDETIEKIEFVNNEIIFYVSIDESAYSLSDLSFTQIKELERSEKFIYREMGAYLRNIYMEDAFENVTLAIAEELDLRFKAICKGESSKEEVVLKMSWREAMTIPNLTFFK